MNPGSITRYYLLMTGLGLAGVGLSYGLSPTTLLPRLLAITVDQRDLVHVFRAVMGLYLAIGAFWFVGAFAREWAGPALLSQVILMGGIAAGRITSLVIDGLPSRLLIVYLGLELGMVIGGIVLLQRTARRSQ